MMECKNALGETAGDIDAAVELLRVKLGDKALKMGGREATEGTVASYIHSNGKVGVLVEIDCNTDFVARNEEFTAFARDIALHIAAANPLDVSAEGGAEDARAEELRIAASQMTNVPEHARERAAQGKVDKSLQEVVLLKQEHVNTDKYGGKSIEALRAELSAKTGENVVIKRFARFQIGS